MSDNNLGELQYKTEMAAVDLGVARYRRAREEKDRSKLSPEMNMMADALDHLVPAFEELQKDAALLKPIKGVHIWGMPVISIDSAKLALLTLTTMVNMVETMGATYTQLCIAVGNAVKTEREFDLIKKTNRDVFRTIMNYRGDDKTYIVSRIRKRAGIVDEKWDLYKKTWVGATLVECVITHTTLFTYATSMVSGKSKTYLMLEEGVKKTLESMHEECEILNPFYLPMVIKPSPRRVHDSTGGGYVYVRTPLVKATQPPEQDSELVIESVNGLQDTAYAVNDKVLATYIKAWKLGGGYGDMPNAHPVALPKIPDDMDTNPDAKADWKARARGVHDLNARENGKRKASLHKLWIASKFRKFDEIYFPVQLDWRGRAYPLPSHLQPQADDPGRALLLFARGKPLGESGLRWLGIHLANCYGYDKVGLNSRLETLHKNAADEIQSWVRDPIRYDSWKTKDKPWQALAAAFEYVEALNLGNPHDYVSRIPVAVDGTCNGLQHFSAIGLDPVGATATNLCDSETPNDIYSQVCGEINAIIDQHCSETEADPKRFPCWAWRGHVTRSVVKRSVMTTPYGVTKAGIRDQFITDGHAKDLQGSISNNANYMRDVTYEAIGATVVAAREYMDWLRTVSCIASRKNKAITWTTPAGFHVEQAYLEDRYRCVTTVLQRIYLRAPTKDWLIDSSRQERGLPPNYIHSLDAAHMMMTVYESMKQGINAFQMIHDSYATHAADMDKFNLILREQFVKLHEQNPLWAFKEQVESSLQIQLPAPPPQGSFDLNQVLTSRHFFS